MLGAAGEGGARGPGGAVLRALTVVEPFAKATGNVCRLGLSTGAGAVYC